MPASPSFPSGTGTGTRGSRWKRRKRDPQAQGANRRLKDDDEEEEDEEDELIDREDDAGGEDPNPNTPDPNPRETEVLSEGGVRICSFPPVVKRTVNRPHSSVLAIAAAERAGLAGESRAGPGIFLENVSYGQLQALSAVPADSPALVDGDGPASFVAQPPQLMQGRGVVKRYGSRVHVVPMHSDWFSPATVHRLERQVVPHFFSGKSADHTPDKYMECRNYIVAKYMENPDKRLTISDCQELVGRVQQDDLIRIVRFLDHWGIINYCAAAAPAPEPSYNASYLKEDEHGEIVVPSAALKSIDSLIRFDKPRCKLKMADIDSPSSPKDEDVLDLDSRIRERLSENHCNHCSRPLLTVYSQSQKEVDVYLCTDCFHEGRFVIGHSSIDFTRVDSTKGFDDLDGESWTDQETLLLLEAMELYDENWNEIADHVGSKSKAQCILHFLRLPTEDGLLENIEVSGVNSSSNLSNGGDYKSSHSTSNGHIKGPHHEDDDSAGRLPFANSGNPVMALVAFLASAVAPRVAAACAHAALAALSAEDGSVELGSIIQVEETTRGHSMNSQTLLGGNSVQQKGGPNEGAGVTSVTVEKVKAAARIGLAAAATKAKLFADHEEREIQRLSANIVNQQLKRLELKLKQFAEVETLLMRECEQVEKTRQRFSSDRARAISSRFGPGGGSTSSFGPGMAPSPNPRGSPIMAGQSSQAGISGYGQLAHSAMPFMAARQQMGFAMGPRLPLSAINASSSSSPSPSSSNPTMFIGPTGNNTQPAGLGHPMMRSAPSHQGSNLG